MQLAPSGAFNKRVEWHLVHQAQRLFIHFYPLEQGPQDLSLLTPIRACQARFHLLSNVLHAAEHDAQFFLLPGLLGQEPQIPFQLGQTLFQPLHARLEVARFDQPSRVGVNKPTDALANLVDVSLQALLIHLRPRGLRTLLTPLKLLTQTLGFTQQGTDVRPDGCLHGLGALPPIGADAAVGQLRNIDSRTSVIGILLL